MQQRLARTGEMPLIEHLYELRRRLVVSVVSIAVAIIPAFIYYQEIFAFLRAPFDKSVADLGQRVSLVLPGVMDPFSLQIQIVGFAALGLASPIWLTQLWRFITPGLKRHEKRWTYIFVVFAIPLLGLGAWLAYRSLPVGLELLLGLTPNGVQNMISVDRYIDFVVKMTLAFSVGFLTPLILVMLNFSGLLRAQSIRQWWRGIVMMTMLFAAIATPTGDPVNMMLLGGPILGLIVIAYMIAATNDWRLRRKNLESGI